MAERTMKPGPFQQLLDEANELGIDTTGYTAKGASSDLLKSRIAEKKADKKLKDAADEAREEIEMIDAMESREQPVMVRVVEWTEWIPAKMVDIGEVADPRDKTGRTMMMQRFPAHNGYTGFVSDQGERLIDLGIEGTGKTRVVELDEKDDEGNSKKVVYGLYVFQAVLARNVGQDFLSGAMDAQSEPLKLEDERKEKAKAEGRDRTKDLIVVENDRNIAQGATPPPNRAARRKANRKRG